MGTTINIPTLELTSTLREAPLNGAPSSQDYNDSQSENLTDLATIVNFINDQLLAIVNALPATASTGLLGETVYSDTSDQTALFYNSLTQSPLVVADSLRYLQSLVNNVATQVNNLNVSVTTLQTRITASSQNDIVQQLNTISNTITQIQSQLNVDTTATGQNTTTLAGFQTARVNSYTPDVTIMDPSGYLQLVSVNYSASAGVGLVIVVQNTDAIDPHTGTVAVLAKAD
jgi:hypothetical protein